MELPLFVDIWVQLCCQCGVCGRCMRTLGTADHYAFVEELHFIRHSNRMKILMTIHLPWTLFPFACTTEVVIIQTWKDTSVTKQGGQRNRC
jgi:hypothetical protein